MAQLHSLLLSPPPSITFLEPHSHSFTPHILSLSLSSTKPTFSLSIRRLHPISSTSTSSSSSSTTIIIQNPNSKTKEEIEVSPTRVLAQNIPWTCTLDDIRTLFHNYGTVLDVELAMHGKTRNRGLAFVEMGSAEEAAHVIAKLEGYEYGGRALKMSYAIPKKKKAVSPPGESKPPVGYNLFVANLHYAARSKDLKEFFRSAGSDIVSAEVVFHENPRKSSGYGFVSFKTKKEADEALTTFEGKELMGRPIRIARSKRSVKPESELKSQLDNGEDMPDDSGEDSEQTESETVDNL